MLEPSVSEALAINGRRFIITGASGWIGLATLELLEHALGDDFAARVACFGSRERELVLRGGRRVVQQPLSALAELDRAPSWLLHFAFLTKDRVGAMSEGAYRRANRLISDTVLASLDTAGVEAAFVASSGAADKAHDPRADAAMRLYGAMKIEDEQRFASWAEERGRRAVIGRIFNLTGPYINKHDAYAIANFILDAHAGRTISVRAPRKVFRGYVAIRELMSLVFAMLAEGGQGATRFDSGGEPLELGDVARAVARVVGKVEVERAAITEPEVDTYAGDGAAYARLLERFAVTPTSLETQVVETATFLSKERI